MKKYFINQNILSLLISISTLFVFTTNAMAKDVTADSCSPTDIQNAANAVQDAGGGKVYIPAGDCSFDGQGTYGIKIDTGSVSFEGAGVGKTILRTTDGSNFFYYTTSGTHPYWTISGITMYSDLGCTSGCQTSAAINIRNTENFRIHHNHLEGYFSPFISPKSVTKGLIDNNFIKNENIGMSGNRYGFSVGMPYDGNPNPISKTPPNGLPICDTDDTYGCHCDVGEPSRDWSSSVAANNTVISSVPARIDLGAASGTGTVRRIYVNIATAGSGATINVASFSRSGNVFTARARTTDLSVLPGLNIFAVDDNEFAPFAIHHGDYLGVYLKNATLEASSSSSYTGWTVTGDQTNQAGVDFGSPDVGPVSIYAELFDDDGRLETCENSWIGWYRDETRGGGYYQAFDRNWTYDENAIFIEDNTVIFWANGINANWGGCAKMVVRHNNLSSPVAKSCTWVKPGNNYAIWHDNVLTDTSDIAGGKFNWVNIDALFYNNTVVNYYGGSTEAYRHYSDYYFPFYVRPKEFYIWNNSYVNSSEGPDEEDNWYSANEGTYWMNLPGENGSIHYRAPKQGERLYGFQEYPYPHPLREGDPPPQTCSEKGGVDCCDNVDYICEGQTFSGASDCQSGVCCSIPCTENDQASDTTPPVISNAQVDPSVTSATITFQTNEASTATITLGGSVVANSTTAATQHSLKVNNLQPSTNYTFTITATDQNQNQSTQGIQTTTLAESADGNWITPDGVHSACNIASADNLIDDDTETVMQHWSNENHWIVLDMGDSYMIDKIRLYHKQWTISRTITEIYVSESAATWGDSLGRLSAPTSTGEESGWRVCNITNKKGRYIKIVTELADSTYLREFDALIQLVPSPPTGLRIINSD